MSRLLQHGCILLLWKGVEIMSTITAENILTLIEQLPAAEQDKLRQLWNQPPAPAEPTNGQTHKAPRDKRMPPLVSAEEQEKGQLAMHWVYEHEREYKNQWVALDGDRLIAAGPQHDEVWQASIADGAKLPFITFIEDPDNITHIIWT
jgi:hypothetical protein